MISVPRTRTVALVLLLAWLGSAAAAVSAAPWLAAAILLAGLIIAAAGRSASVIRGAKRDAGHSRIPTMRRVEAFLEGIDRLPIDEFRMLAVPVAEDHEAAVDQALQAAAAAGRRDVANDLRRSVDAGVARRFAEGGYDATMFGLGWRSEPTGPADRARVAGSIRDAALGLLVEDVVDDGTFAELVGPCAALVPEV